MEIPGTQSDIYTRSDGQ